MNKPRVLYLIYHTPNIKFYTKFTLPIIRKYVERQGYDFAEYTEDFDIGRHKTWYKFLLIANHIGEDKPYDWIIFADADVVPLDHNVDLRDYIKEDYNIIMDAEYSTTDFNNMRTEKACGNTGLIFVRNCKWCKEFLIETFNDPQWKDYHKPEGYVHEQSAINFRWWREKEVKEKIFIYPPHTIFGLYDTTKPFLHPYGLVPKLMLLDNRLEKHVKY